MTFSPSTLSLMAMLALGLSVLAVVYQIVGTGQRKHRVIDPGQPLPADEALRDILEGQAEQIERLEHAVRALNATDRRQQGMIDGAVRKVALFRYDAFEDVGGRLSFSCALLDDHATGVVLTSINGRQETRVYAKPVTEGRSSYNLSLEEEEAIRQAVASTAPTSARSHHEQALERRTEQTMEAR